MVPKRIVSSSFSFLLLALNNSMYKTSPHGQIFQSIEPYDLMASTSWPADAFYQGAFSLHLQEFSCTPKIDAYALI